MSEAPETALPTAHCNPGSNRRAAEEDRAWAQLYASVAQDCTAEEVVKQLEALRVFQWDPALAGRKSSLPQKNRIRVRKLSKLLKPRALALMV